MGKTTRIMCKNCEEMTELVDSRICQECGEESRPAPSPKITDMWTGGGITLDHVDENPRHFTSKGQLKRFCKEKKIYSNALL